MLRWLPKSMPRKYRQLLRLCGISAAAHIVVLFLFLFVYTGDSSLQFDVFRTSINTEVPIVVLPYCKRVDGPKHVVKRRARGPAGTGGSEIKTKPAEQSAVQKNEPIKKAPTSLVSCAKAKSKQGSGAQKKDSKKVVEKKRIKKGDDKPQAKKGTAKTAAEQKKNEPVFKKAEEKEKPVVAEKPAEIEKPKVEQSCPAPVIDSVSTPGSLDPIPPGAVEGDAIYVGRDEYAMMMKQEEIQKEMSSHWQPPAGLDPELVCQVSVSVDWAGVVSRVAIHKSSGVAMYDMSARQAIVHFVPPQWAYGKEITITFKQ